MLQLDDMMSSKIFYSNFSQYFSFSETNHLTLKLIENDSIIQVFFDDFPLLRTLGSEYFFRIGVMKLHYLYSFP